MRLIISRVNHPSKECASSDPPCPGIASHP
jgi:hypothetical protein